MLFRCKTLVPFSSVQTWRALFTKVKQPEREADYSSPSSSEVKNQWSRTFIPTRLRGLYSDYFFSFSVRLTTHPQPFAQRVLHRVRSSASASNFHYPRISLRSSSSCLRLLPRLPLILSLFLFSFSSVFQQIVATQDVTQAQGVRQADYTNAANLIRKVALPNLEMLICYCVQRCSEQPQQTKAGIMLLLEVSATSSLYIITLYSLTVLQHAPFVVSLSMAAVTECAIGLSCSEHYKKDTLYSI